MTWLSYGLPFLAVCSFVGLFLVSHIAKVLVEQEQQHLAAEWHLNPTSMWHQQQLPSLEVQV
jgi:hypothetical protein